MHLLKCQIVRILYSSSICLRDYLKLNENFKIQFEGKITEYNDEYKSTIFDKIKLQNMKIEYINKHIYFQVVK